MSVNAQVEEQAVAHHRRFCMSCGTRLAQEASRRVGLCQGCRRHCICCGRHTGTYGYYDVCLRCKTVIDKCIEYMKRHKGRLPPEKNAESGPARRASTPRRATCVSCGDPAEAVFNGRPYCADCYAEKEGGADNE